ncbi:MAG: fatty acid hydroxylase [Verrucomicrobia bacterium]|nr:MAG: fatty acid hydroxylase [Verrucomicrobiota bacterium]
MAERLYVSNKNETVRMFESDFMEFFSRVHPVIPLVLYLPVVGYMLYVSLWQGQLSIIAVTALFLLGVLLWTLIEYLIHRYVFHYEPKTRWGKQLHYVIHGVHHDYPNDARRLVMPPVISIPLAFLFYGLFFLIFGSLTPAVFAWLWLKQYHLRHHFKDDHVGYGISSPLWDYVFRTTRK